MHSDSDSTDSIPELQVSFFSDTIVGIRKTIEGLAQLAGLEGLDAVTAKLEEAVEECENLLKGDPCLSDQQPALHGTTRMIPRSGG